MSLLLQRLSREFMREIGTKSREVYELLLPPVDVFEDGSELVIVMDMPGFAKEKIRTRISDHTLIVSAKRDPVERDGMVYWEQRPLRIHKKIPIPVKIDLDEEAALKARYENGVLTVRLPMKNVGRVTLE